MLNYHIAYLDAAFQHHCDPHPFCPTAVFYHRCIKSLDLLYQLSWESSWFLIFSILKGTRASQGASKWRNWEPHNSSKSRVRPIHVICEDWSVLLPTPACMLLVLLTAVTNQASPGAWCLQLCWALVQLSVGVHRNGPLVLGLSLGTQLVPKKISKMNNEKICC